MKNLIRLLFILLAYPALAQNFAPGLNADINSGGRLYDVITPTNYNPANLYDVVFLLHGLGGDKTTFRNQAAVDALNIIAVLPEATVSIVPGIRMWNSFTFSPTLTNNTDDVTYLATIATEVDNRLPYVASDRMFVFGASNGASMALRMARENSIFKAYSIFAMSDEESATIPAGTPKKPMLFTQGIADQVIPYQGGAASIAGITMGNFAGLQKTANRWATYNTGSAESMDIRYEELQKPVNYFREFRDLANKKAPVYVYAVEGQQHTTTGLFDPMNVVINSVRFFRGPLCFGLSRQYCEQNNIMR